MYIIEDVWKSYLAGSEELFKVVGKSFLDSYKNFKQDVLDSFEDHDKVYNLIHSLKGITLNLGMRPLYEICQEACENMKLKNIYDYDLTLRLIDVFEESYKELRGLLS